MSGTTPALCLLLALVACVPAHADEDPNAIAKEMMKQCATQCNIEEAKIKENIEKKKLPESKEEKCVVDCFYRKAGIISIDNKMNSARLKELNEMKLKDKPELKTKADTIVDNCEKEVGNPQGEYELATKLTECIAKQAKSMGIKQEDIQ